MTAQDPSLEAKLKRVSMLDAMTAVAKQLPDDGITLREFFTRAARLSGDTDEVVEEALRLAEADGHMEDDIVKIGVNGSRMS